MLLDLLVIGAGPAVAVVAHLLQLLDFDDRFLQDVRLRDVRLIRQVIPPPRIEDEIAFLLTCVATDDVEDVPGISVGFLWFRFVVVVGPHPVEGTFLESHLFLPFKSLRLAFSTSCTLGLVGPSGFRMTFAHALASISVILRRSFTYL